MSTIEQMDKFLGKQKARNERAGTDGKYHTQVKYISIVAHSKLAAMGFGI